MSKYNLPVYGYSEQQKTLYQFLDVFSILVINATPTKTPTVPYKRRIPVKTFPTKLEATEKVGRRRFLVVAMRQCEWLQIRKQPKVSCFLKTLKSVTPKLKLCFEKILKAVQNETLYGVLIVDIHTPDELKKI